MCSMYWNLVVEAMCPRCGSVGEWELQTHFMGVAGSCLGTYRVGDVVPELKGVDVVLDGDNDSLYGFCPACDEPADFGATIKGGRVLSVHPLPSEEEN